MIAYLFIDIDDFGDINKKFGFAYGNKVLKRFKSHIRHHFSKEGTVFHFGADSFLVSFKGSYNYDDLIDRVNRFLNHEIVFHANHHTVIKVTSCIGISVEKEHADEFWELVRCADVALRDAKMTGKNIFRIYHRNSDDLSKLRFDIKQNMSRGIAKNEFEMVYQPIVDAKSLEVVGYEALLRWHHKFKEPISTSELIEIAEQSGQMPTLEEWIIKEVFSQAKVLLNNPHIKFISINLSPKGLTCDKLVQLLEDLHNTYKVESSIIIFEHTEGYLIQNFEQGIEQMKALMKLGYRFALDDFGTGYSSLSYMSRLPVSKLKIDRSFINKIETNEKDKMMAKSIIDLAHNLNLKVVVEGVERQSQAELLREMDSDYFQGYLYSKAKCIGDIVI